MKINKFDLIKDSSLIFFIYFYKSKWSGSRNDDHEQYKQSRSKHSLIISVIKNEFFRMIYANNN